MEDLNLSVIDNTEDTMDINQVMMQCNRVEMADFIPPHFIPDVDTAENILALEKVIEEKAAAFDYNGGVVLFIEDARAFEYLQKIYNKLYEDSATKGKFVGTEREIFSINYFDISQKLHSTKCKLAYIKNDVLNNRRIVRFTILKSL